MTRRPARTETGRFLAEGAQAVREALGCPGTVLELFGTAQALDRHAELVGAAQRAGVPVSAVSDRGMAGLSETVTPQGLVAVCRFVDVPLAAALHPPGGPPRLVTLLAAVRDPGNAGTVLRTADAVGAGAVLFSTASVDPYNGKCVRACAGSLFHLPVVRGTDPVAAVAALQAAGLRVLAAAADGEADLADLAADGTLAAPTGWLFGNEARGLPGDLADRADARVRIRMSGRAESLNLATAAAICLYASSQLQTVYASQA